MSQTYDAMTQTQRFGQLFMVGLQPDQAPSGLDSTIRTWQIGSVIYLGGWSGAATVRATSEHLQQAAGGPVDLFIAADQEGGAVQQLKGLGFTVLPAALEQGALSSTRLTSLGATMARELAAAGVNVNLAPVADTVPPTMVATNAPIGKYRRELGTDPAVVAAAASGAGLVTVSNLYGYGPVEGAVHPALPLAATGTKGRVRAQMWRDAKAAHDAGRIRATELRASDYFGPGVRPEMSVLQRFVFTPAVAGKTVRPFDGSPDAPHSWTYVPDIAAVAAALATSDTGWGRAWHVPSGMPRSLRQAASDAAAFAGQPDPVIRPVPATVRRLLGLVAPVIRELDETAWQRERPRPQARKKLRLAGRDFAMSQAGNYRF